MRPAKIYRFWRRVNPVVLPLAGFAPWWVLLETTGHRSGLPRHTPLAAGPREGDGIWLIAVRGSRTAWVRNLTANPSVRLRRTGRWHRARAEVRRWDPAMARRFNGMRAPARRSSVGTRS